MRDEEARDRPDSQERVVETRLVIAQEYVQVGDLDKAEDILLKALKLAEAATGQSSALVGRVLVDLFDIYQKQDKNAEAERVWQRLRQILITCLTNLDDVKSR